MPEHVTLLTAANGGPVERDVSTGLPSDLLGQSAARLRVLALLYAFIFFMAGIVPALLLAGRSGPLPGQRAFWGPSVLGIVVAAARRGGDPERAPPASHAMNARPGLRDRQQLRHRRGRVRRPGGLEAHRGMIGLSWVAVWVVLFTVVVPTSPRRAAAGRPGLGQLGPRHHRAHDRVRARPRSRPDPAQFFFGLVFPYLLVVGMAYVGARVVYQLGTEVKRARELGSYRLEEKLGEGGMGEVWRARHRMLARPAAIKLIRPSLGGRWPSQRLGRAIRRFEREAQVIARLRSPHTVELFDFGVAADGAFYYVMELLDGLDADIAAPAVRAAAAGAGDLPAAPGLPLARPRRSRAAWCTATSSPPTSSSAATARSTTS